jgi:hypothetical protein
MFTNFSWAVFDFAIGAYGQGALFAIYFLLAIKGAYEWRKYGHR